MYHMIRVGEEYRVPVLAVSQYVGNGTWNMGPTFKSSVSGVGTTSHN